MDICDLTVWSVLLIWIFQILDTLKLNISKIYDTETNESLQYSLDDHIPDYGRKLTIQLPRDEKTM